MEQRKETPKKYYPKSSSASESKCRLCGGIFEKKYCKNLFAKRNENLLRSAEIINGGNLVCEDGFPNLLCRPCERRLDNFAKFRKMVCEVQSSLSRKKRCIEVSPSAPISSAKSSRASFSGNVTSRRSLSFGTSDSQALQSESDSSLQV